MKKQIGIVIVAVSQKKLRNKIRNYCAGRLKKITGNEIALKNSRSWPT